MLIDYGADLNLKNNHHVTPLFYASNQMLKALGIQDGTTSAYQQINDNNGLYFNPPNEDNLYPDHYY